MPGCTSDQNAAIPCWQIMTSVLDALSLLPGGLGAYAASWLDWPAWAPFTGGLVEWAGNHFGDDRLFIRINGEHSRPRLEIDALSADGDWEIRDTARVRV